MLRKIVSAAFVAAVVVSLAGADEFFAGIRKVDGNNVTFVKFKKGEKGKGEETTLPATATVKVLSAKFNEDKKIDVGEALPNGLQNERLKNIEKGVFAQIVTDDGKITEIRVLPPFKKKNQ
jgi:hypothetical protein